MLAQQQQKRSISWQIKDKQSLVTQVMGEHLQCLPPHTASLMQFFFALKEFHGNEICTQK